MDSTHKQRDLWVISLVAIVNALGYGIIIPLQYAYVARFGINAFWLGVLFAAFSLAQFISTPIIGRLSDRHGRKPLLFISVLGTALSFFLFAIANSAPVIFVARLLDGVTGGNISVAQAVISDVTEPHERAKWFGILGAAFGFGFVVGPAIGGTLSKVSLSAPFFFAGLIALIACLIIWFVQKESLHEDTREKKTTAALFDLKHLFNALFEPFVGLMLIANFIAMFAFSIFILGFQTFTNDVLKLSPFGISAIFVMFGIVGLIMQGFATGRLVKIFSEVPLLIFGVVLSGFSFFLMGISRTLPLFVFASLLLAIGNSFLAPLITAILSKHTKREDQGGMMGINQAYGSLANIIGPIIGGTLAVRHVSFAFFGAGLTLVLMFFLTMIISRESGKHVIDL